MWRWVVSVVMMATVASAVLHRKSYTTSQDDKPLYTNSWAVQVVGGPQAANDLATKYGFDNLGQVGNLKDIYHFMMPKKEFDSESKAKGISEFQPLYSVTNALKQEEKVGLVEQQAEWKVEKKGFLEPIDPHWNQQWSLLNTGQSTNQNNDDAGHDLNVVPAWIQGYTGCGSIVGIVDDGVGYTNPDLVLNYVTTLDYDYQSGDRNPFPVDPENFGTCESDHGTCCAGEIAMEKGNDHCGVGVAYQSTIAGIRLLGPTLTDIMVARALGHRNNVVEIYSNSWGPLDTGFIVFNVPTIAKMALEEGVKNGRNGAGSIFVWASGNGGEQYDSCAADGLSSSIYTIGIGSAASDGSQAYYDEQCSAKMAVTFVNNPHPSGTNSVVATTADGACTGDFDGTSAACPLASGVIALVLEANPLLTWRDVQYLIAYTSNPEILVDGEWTTNGGGLEVSHKFGFGAIDAEAMVTRARRWINVPEQESDTVDSSPSRNMIFQGPSEFTFSYNGDIGFTEHVVVTLSFDFDISSSDYEEIYDYLYDYDYGYYIDPDRATGRGNIQVELVSPSGTRSVIFPYRPRDILPGDLEDFPLMSVHFWGEDPQGTWLLTINTDVRLDYRLTVSDVSMTVYGTMETPEAVARIPPTCDIVCARGCAASGPQYCDACAEDYVRNATTLECILEQECLDTARNGYCYDPQAPEPECTRETFTDIDSLPDSARAVGISFLLFLLSLSVGFGAIIF